MVAIVNVFNDSTLENRILSSWSKSGVFQVRFVASGNEHCFAPKFPSIEVTSANVTTNGDVQFSGKLFSLTEKNGAFYPKGGLL